MDKKTEKKKELSQAIKTYRARHQLTQQQLADKLGISHMQIIRWEHGHTYPSLLAIKALREMKVLL